MIFKTIKPKKPFLTTKIGINYSGSSSLAKKLKKNKC